MSGSSGYCYRTVKPCGCLSGLCAEYPEDKSWSRELARFLADAARAGLKIERVTTEEARRSIARCPEHEAEQKARMRQADLFGGAP